MTARLFCDPFAKTVLAGFREENFADIGYHHTDTGFNFLTEGSQELISRKAHETNDFCVSICKSNPRHAAGCKPNAVNLRITRFNYKDINYRKSICGQLDWDIEV